MIIKKFTALFLAMFLISGVVAPAFASNSSGVSESVTFNIKDCEISHKTDYTYSGEKITPKVTVKFEGEKLRENTDYKVSYKNNKSYGTATITVKGIKPFRGSVTSKFRIAPKKVRLKNLKSDFTMRFTAKWSRNKNADGYRLECSLDKDFGEFRFKTVKNNKTLSTTLRGLEAGKKYYVRIRSFKTTKRGRVYSKYSDVETVRIKKTKKETSKKNKICLTFDDGPSFVTEDVLDVLKANRIKATFFIVNYKKAQKPIIQRIIDEGHTLAIHNYSHDYANIYKSTSSYMKNHMKLYDKIKKDFNYKAKIMRFPGGTSNTVSRNYSDGIMKKLSKKITKKGFTYFDWNVDSGDASGNNVSKKIIANNVIKGLSKKRTNVVLMHDSGAKSTTAKALQKIIDYGNNNGYVFERITEKTSKIQHKPNN